MLGTRTTPIGFRPVAPGVEVSPSKDVLGLQHTHKIVPDAGFHFHCHVLEVLLIVRVELNQANATNTIQAS